MEATFIEFPICSWNDRSRLMLQPATKVNLLQNKKWFIRRAPGRSTMSQIRSRNAGYNFTLSMTSPPEVVFAPERTVSHPVFNGQISKPSIAVPAAVPESTVSRTPLEIYKAHVAIGLTKANLSIFKTFILGIMAGAFIGVAALLNVTISGQLAGLPPAIVKGAGAFFFPFGLQLVLLTGSEMFTGNTMVTGSALLANRVRLGDMAKNWGVSWLGNLVGGVGCAALAAGAGLLKVPGVGEYSAALAVAKCLTKLPIQLFLQGIICNSLVCLAILSATSAKDTTGKILGCWIPIVAFVTMGVEHSVANMFLIPAGMFSGAGVSALAFLKNLLIVSLGNAVGGLGFVGLLNHLIHKQDPSPAPSR
mmetsp:Transcript_10992/g.19236  ORF Transcript_10992/g.19236 Transcript_10992/m.19236 type:complete len:363 (-) Transcript_10992:602-1690(-)